ncbi:MAG: long-chain fatty acid--CoA ligase [Actinomycetia bacterium]|nr:long-chain fatty acid--CoA ligase [Actinomycetes bacterium]
MTTRSYDWIGHHALVRGDQPAMVDLATNRSFTYREMDERTCRLASALATDFGIGHRDRVAVLANNNSNFFEVQFACWKLGAIFVPLNWRLAIPELEYIVGDCSPKVIVHDNDFAEAVDKLAATSSIVHRISWEDADGDTAAYEEVLAAASPTVENYPSTHDTVLTIMYTSGTTGRPKGAEITQGMTLWNAISCVEFFSLHSDMVNLAFLPLFHTGGLNVFANPAFHFGGLNLIMRTFDPAGALSLLSDPELGVTHFIGVPANYLFMSQVPAFAETSFPTITAAAVGGSPTPLPLIQAWDAVGLPLQQAFGMTETSPLVLALKPEDCSTKIGSAGLPAMHTEVRIVDEDGNDVGPGVNGELWVRGPNVTPGYWNRPDATADSFDDGWLKTGDAARTDDEGFYYIVDRWKDMYISGGENVYPAEVESVIYQLPQIGEVAVIGVADERWVEVGRAIVVRKVGEEIDETTIINHCRENLARFKVPQSVVFIDEIPHNATGKVLKRELRDSYGAP